MLALEGALDTTLQVRKQIQTGEVTCPCPHSSVIAASVLCPKSPRSQPCLGCNQSDSLLRGTDGKIPGIREVVTASLWVGPGFQPSLGDCGQVTSSLSLGFLRGTVRIIISCSLGHCET